MRLGFAAAFFALYLGIQIAVPAIQIYRGKNSFRWGMFSEYGEINEISVEYVGGSRESLNHLWRRTGRGKVWRAEMNLGKRLPAYLCSGTPKPVRIVVRDIGARREEQYPCP